MAFSFSPGQIAPEGSQAGAMPGTLAPGVVAAPIAGPPSDSPFLFIRERGGPISIMACVQIVLIVVAILSVIICATLYSYTIYLKNQIATNQEKLLTLDAELPDYPYDKMSLLSKRMAVLDKLLQEYISPRSPLKFLENIVENRVVFDAFKLSKDRNGAYTVSFNAITSDYVSLVQQLRALDLTEYQKIAPNPKLGGIAESPTTVKVNITTPVLVQGKLPDDVVFFVTKPKTSASTTPQVTQPATSTSTELKTTATQ